MRYFFRIEVVPDDEDAQAPPIQRRVGDQGRIATAVLDALADLDEGTELDVHIEKLSEEDA